MEQYGPLLQAFMDSHVKAAAAAELTESQAFIEQQAKFEGAVRMASGIIMREMNAGDISAVRTRRTRPTQKRERL